MWEGSMVKKTLYKGFKLGIVKSNDTMELIAITEHSSLKSIYEKKKCRNEVKLMLFGRGVWSKRHNKICLVIDSREKKRSGVGQAARPS